MDRFAGSQLGDKLGGLSPQHGLCKVCGPGLRGKISLFSADVDQDFEGCAGANESDGWRLVRCSCEDHFSTSCLQIMGGKCFAYRIGAPGPGAGGSWL